MTIIEAHRGNEDALLRSLSRSERDLEHYLSILPDGGSINDVLGEVFSQVCLLPVFRPESSELRRMLHLGASCVEAIFVLSSGESTFELVGCQVLPEIVDEGSDLAANWLMGFWLAVLSDDHELATRLCEIIPEPDGSGINPAYIDEYVAGVQECWLFDEASANDDDDDPHQHFVNAMQAYLDDDEAGRFDDGYDAMIVSPLILLTSYLFSDDERFAETFVTAVKNHQQYWLQKSTTSRDGLWSIPLTAILRLAYLWERELPDLQSGYVPEFLVKGEFRESHSIE